MKEDTEPADSKAPTYHDLYITTEDIPRTSIFNLPFELGITCTRVGGWELWRHMAKAKSPLAGEYEPHGLRLDVAGHVIVDTIEECKKRRVERELGARL